MNEYLSVSIGKSSQKSAHFNLLDVYERVPITFIPASPFQYHKLILCLNQHLSNETASSLDCTFQVQGFDVHREKKKKAFTIFSEPTFFFLFIIFWVTSVNSNTLSETIHFKTQEEEKTSPDVTDSYIFFTTILLK